MQRQVAVGILAYSPTLRSQIQLVESDGPGSEAFRQATRRGATLGIVIGLITVVIIFLTATKPPLWG